MTIKEITNLIKDNNFVAAHAQCVENRINHHELRTHLLDDDFARMAVVFNLLSSGYNYSDISSTDLLSKEVEAIINITNENGYGRQDIINFVSDQVEELGDIEELSEYDILEECGYDDFTEYNESVYIFKP